jgi:primosomal protein N' (replication factor Y)
VLTQVAGRAGRSPLGGKVILQSFHPDHYAIQAASKHDYKKFYEHELNERRRLRYPPFSNLIRLLYRNEDNRKSQENAESMGAKLKALIQKQDRRNTELIGPVPSYYERLNRQYRWQIILRGPDPISLLRGFKLIDWQVEVNPPSLL